MKNKLEKLEAKLRRVAADLQEISTLGDLEYQVRKLNKIADDVATMSTQGGPQPVHGHGTGKE